MRIAELTLVLIGALLTNIAEAQSYSSHSSKVALCDNVAMGARLNYARKQRGMPMMPPLAPSYTSPLDAWAFDYGYNQAANDQDAGRVAFAKCMDVVDRLTRDFKADGTIHATLPK